MKNLEEIFHMKNSQNQLHVRQLTSLKNFLSISDVLFKGLHNSLIIVIHNILELVKKDCLNLYCD